MLTHRNLMAMTVAHLADIDDPDEECSLIHAAPMSHGSGLYILPYVLRGARQVMPASAGSIRPNSWISANITRAQRVSSRRPWCNGWSRRAGSVRAVCGHRLRRRPDVCGQHEEGAGRVRSGVHPDLRPGRVADDDHRSFAARTTRRRRRDPRVGRLPRGRAWKSRCCADDDTPAATGEIGEIVCRGDVVMSGYWRNPAATGETLTRRWMRTGDMGSFDARGYLTLHDRSKDVVISGGSNIYPREVEEALLEHPAVSEACVVAAPDAEWGEVVVAFIVGRPPPATGRAPAQRIARFKRPKRYLSWTNCRRTATARCSSASCGSVVERPTAVSPQSEPQ